MVQGPASKKIRFSIDDKGERDELTTLDGIQVSLSDSVNDKEEISERFEDSEADSKRINFMGSHQKVDFQSEKPSPLGLTLKKTPSFLDLIEMTLAQARSRRDSEKNRAGSEENNISVQPNAAEKLKASNFPANLLRIGTWKRVSIYEGDLVAKCYFAKHKLVWEVLDRGLKSKIEIQWSDISAIRANFRKNEADILEIELSRAPMFFRESNPQPRKHTLWQTASDFTGGQAPIYRRHYVQFPEGTLERHYQKLLQCDNRLFELSKKPFPALNLPYFNTSFCGYPDIFFGLNGHHGLVGSQFPHMNIPSRPINAMTLHQLHNFETIRPSSFTVNDSISPMAVMDIPYNIKENGINYSRQQHQRAPIWVQGINNDQNLYRQEDSPLICQQLLYHQQLPFGGESVNNHTPPAANNLLLNEIADHLLNDPFASVCSDEQRVLAKVKSMCNLLDMSKEPIRTSGNGAGGDANSIEHFNVCKAYGGSDFLCPDTLNWLPTQVSNENQLMNLTRCPSSCVDPHANYVKKQQW